MSLGWVEGLPASQKVREEVVGVTNGREAEILDVLERPKGQYIVHKRIPQTLD